MHIIFFLFVGLLFSEPLIGQTQHSIRMLPNVNEVLAQSRESIWLMPIKANAFRECVCSQSFGSRDLLYTPQKPPLEVVKYILLPLESWNFGPLESSRG